jgi:hypothetical protein
MVLADLSWILVLSASSPSSLFSTCTGSGPEYAVVDCFKVDQFALREEASREDVEDSLEANDKEEDLGVTPGRCCDVM